MFSKITDTDFSKKLKHALSYDKQGNPDKVDSKAEYDLLAQLLSGCEKDSEAYRHVDKLMVEYRNYGNINGNNNKSSVNNTVSQTGYGNVNGDNNTVSVNVNTYYTDQSRNRGARLADILVGLSDGDKYPEVRRTITSDVSADNIMEVLRGYEDQRPSASMFTNGNHFFEQLFTESGFDRKDEMIKTMARKLKEYFVNKEDSSNAKEIAKQIDTIIRKPNLSKEDVQTLDSIYMQELGE